MEVDGYRTLREAWFIEGDTWSHVTETVAREEAVALYLDDRLVEVVSCTPEDLCDLAVGYLFTSGAIDGFGGADRVITRSGPAGFEARVLPAVPGNRGPSRIARVEQRPFAVAPEAIHRASAALLANQRMHRDTGATHGAAFADRAGAYRYVREDIGRHNAVDKLIGALVRDGVDPESGFVHLSSRCALDLVKKCSTYDIRLITTVSAPTSAVLSFADERNITLCAFARNGHCTVYTHPENLKA